MTNTLDTFSYTTFDNYSNDGTKDDIYIRNKSGSWRKIFDNITRIPINALCCADIDGDRRTELLIAASTAGLWCWKYIDNSFHRIDSAANCISIAACDVDGDRKAELFEVDNNGASFIVSTNTNDSLISKLGLQPPDSSGNAKAKYVACGDVNMDGLSDVFFTFDSLAGIEWLNSEEYATMLKTGHLIWHNISTGTKKAAAIALGDIDGNSYDDLIVRWENSGDSLWVRHTNPAEATNGWIPYYTGVNARSFTTAKIPR